MRILLILLMSVPAFAQVRVYQGEEVIPTYKLGADEISPMFYTGRSVQGAQGKVYPYPLQTKLSDSLVDVAYNMVYLENEYLKVKILPALGGRLYSAIDKTNGHELFHTNSVIKPDLIGTLGAWISGGIEWCFPHHHRTTTMLPSDFITVENEDGSATVWIGETEKTMRLRGVVGVTLRPGRSYIEVDYRINNTNNLTKTFLFWANVAITANEDFRTFWPPSSEIAVFHNNRSFIQWPISNLVEEYGRTGYPEGVDLTWWKNHPNPVSFFMWDNQEGFVGGYDYGQRAGTMHVGDPHENKTSKLWQFGPGTQGQNARRKLTDDGKAYVEIMTGTFSNNQPDYSWILPHSVKDAKNFWYPLREIEVAQNSSLDASVTLQMRDPKTVFYGFNTTRVFEEAQLTLKYGDDVLVHQSIDIDPANPFTATFKSRKALDEYQLHIQLTDSKGQELISYTPYKLQHPKLPKPQERVKSPQELETVEDLYLTGRFVEQFNRPGINPDDYYLQALTKSPEDYRVNIALGLRRLKQTKYLEALEHFQQAADKLNIQYYQPQEGELYYYMALAQKNLGQKDQAYSNFARATWYYSCHSAGYYQLSLLESQTGNYEKALEYVQNAYSTNNRDGRIVVLYSALLRRLGKGEEAIKLLDQQLAYDPLDFGIRYEKILHQTDASLTPWHHNMQDVPNNYLEMATTYMHAGFWEEGGDLLSSLESPDNPLIYYYRSWFYSQLGQDDKASDMVNLAKQAPLEYCFPYREETGVVLEHALTIDPEDATAYYLLGNLLYDDRPEEAMKAWQRAAAIDNQKAMVRRNLAFGAFYHLNDPTAAISYMTEALQRADTIPQWYAELSRYYDQSDLAYNECLDILRGKVDIVKQDISAPKSLVALYNLNGEYDEAIEILQTHHFRTWEGGREIYWRYVDAHTLKAIELMKDQEFSQAAAELDKALLYPENLEVGKPSDDEKNALIYYYMGLAYDQLGESKLAKNYFQKSTDSQNRRGMHDLLYFQARSYEKLGNSLKAQELFRNLIDLGKEQRTKGADKILIAVEEGTSGNGKLISNSYYLEALGNLGMEKTDEARNLLERALRQYPNNLWAKVMLGTVND